MSFNSINSQTPHASLKKNVNVLAEGLYHDLNSAKDTLILKSDKKINYVYSLNRNGYKEVNLTVNAKGLEVPLKGMSKGRHLFVVIQSPLKIVFVVNILKDGAILVTREEMQQLTGKGD